MTSGLAAVVAVLAGVQAGVAQEVVGLPADDRPLGAEFDEVFRVGSFDGEVWETFGELAGVAFDAAGNLYILDRQASVVTVVDGQGRLLRQVGQAGEGPGEFRMPMSFTVMHDGRLVVADIGHRSFQLFGADGEFERMVSMGSGETIRLGDMAPAPGGESIISSAGGSVVAMRSGPGGPAQPTTRPIELLSLSGDVAEATTLVEAWLPPRSDEPEEIEGGGMRFSVSTGGPRTFEPALLVGALPDGGVAFTDSTTYRVKVTGPDGRVERIIERGFEPRRVTERMQEAEKERRLAELEAGDGPRMRIMVNDGAGGGARSVGQDAINEMMRGRIEQMQFYPELPVLMDLQSSWTGKLWAQRRGDQPTEPGPIDVMTTDGRYVGTFATGALAMPDAFGPDGLAAWVETDEFDVPTVVVRRLPPVIN